MSDTAYEADYLEGIEHFNARDFFEAHEAWEDIWAKNAGPSQLFYKGLIHAAVALHHFGNGNTVGARKVLGTCVQYLTPYAPRHLGLDVAAFLSQMKACFAALNDPHPPAVVALDEARIPTISLDPPASSTQGD